MTRYLLKSIVSVLILVILSCSDNAVQKNTQSAERDIYTKLEELEIATALKLDSLRNEFLENLPMQPASFYALPFHDAKKLIEGSNLFELFKQLPKGGLLHTHSGGITDVEWVIDRASRMEECYVNLKKDTGDFVYGELQVFPSNKVPNGFEPLNAVLEKNPEFREELFNLLTISGDNPNQDIWEVFENRFKRIWKLIGYRPFFKEYYLKAFHDIAEDGIQHLEIRFIFDSLYDFEVDNYPLEVILKDFQEILSKINEDYPQFSLSLIYTSFKFFDNEVIGQQLSTAFELKQKYPTLISGFDLVSEEKKGNSISYYSKAWKKMDSLQKQYGFELPLHLHAGESNSRFNTNIEQSLFLPNSRIGHGFNALLFPKTLDAIKEKDILIEVCPWSNKILGYVNDLRNHPSRSIYHFGIPMALSNDDPSVFGYTGLSHDFFIVYLAWELELADLKTLIFNSIQYSGLSEERKKESSEHLKRKWEQYIMNIDEQKSTVVD